MPEVTTSPALGGYLEGAAERTRRMSLRELREDATDLPPGTAVLASFPSEFDVYDEEPVVRVDRDRHGALVLATAAADWALRTSQDEQVPDSDTFGGTPPLFPGPAAEATGHNRELTNPVRGMSLAELLQATADLPDYTPVLIALVTEPGSTACTQTPLTWSDYDGALVLLTD